MFFKTNKVTNNQIMVSLIKLEKEEDVLDCIMYHFYHVILLK